MLRYIVCILLVIKWLLLLLLLIYVGNASKCALLFDNCPWQWMCKIQMQSCEWNNNGRPTSYSLSGVPDLWDRNKILSGGDLSHYQVPHCIRVFFFLFDLCLFITIFNFILNYVLIVTFWIFTYHKIWILLIIYFFIWNYLFIYFLTCLEVFWSVVS